MVNAGRVRDTRRNSHFFNSIQSLGRRHGQSERCGNAMGDRDNVQGGFWVAGLVVSPHRKVKIISRFVFLSPYALHRSCKKVASGSSMRTENEHALILQVNMNVSADYEKAYK